MISTQIIHNLMFSPHCTVNLCILPSRNRLRAVVRWSYSCCVGSSDSSGDDWSQKLFFSLSLYSSCLCMFMSRGVIYFQISSCLLLQLKHLQLSVVFVRMLNSHRWLEVCRGICCSCARAGVLIWRWWWSFVFLNRCRSIFFLLLTACMQ